MTGNELINFIIANHLEDYKFVGCEHENIYDIYLDIDDGDHQALIYLVDFL